MVAANNKVVYELTVAQASDAKSKLQAFGDDCVKQQDRITAAATKSSQDRAQAEAQASGKIQGLMDKAAQGQKGWYSQLSALDKHTADQVFQNRSKLLAQIGRLDAKRTQDVEKANAKEASAADKLIELQTKASEKAAQAREKAAEKAAEAEAKGHEQAEHAIKHAERERKKRLHEITETIEEAGRAMILLNLATEEDTEKALKLWATFEGGVKLVHSLNEGIHEGVEAWRSWRAAAAAAKAAQAVGGAASAAGAAGGAAGTAGAVGGIAALFNPIGLAVGVAALAVGAFALACQMDADAVKEAAEKRKKEAEDADKERGYRQEDDQDTARFRRERADESLSHAELTGGAGKTGTDKEIAEKQARAAELQKQIAEQQDRASKTGRAYRSARSQAKGERDVEYGMHQGEEFRKDADSHFDTAVKDAEQFRQREIDAIKEAQRLTAEQRTTQQDLMQKEAEAKKQAIESAQDQISQQVAYRDKIKQAGDELKKQQQTLLGQYHFLDPMEKQRVNASYKAGDAALKSGDYSRITKQQAADISTYGTPEQIKALNAGLAKLGEAEAAKAGIAIGNTKEIESNSKELQNVTQEIGKLAGSLNKLGVDLGKIDLGTVQVEDIKHQVTLKIEADSKAFSAALAKALEPYYKTISDLSQKIQGLENNQKQDKRQAERAAGNDQASASSRAAIGSVA